MQRWQEKMRFVVDQKAQAVQLYIQTRKDSVAFLTV